MVQKQIKLYLLSFLLIIGFSSNGQDPLSPGFTLLESGSFKEAAVFFKKYLETDSTNQTALLCYGRGTGLSGNTDEAKEVFANLQKLKPGDFEVDINMAEAHMWSKEYPKALELYKDLYARDPKIFAGVLGLANAFSENKDYDEALDYIERALAIDSLNQSAKTSRKYMRLGKAAQLSNLGDFDNAIVLYSLILEELPDDKDGLITRAQAYTQNKQYAEAKADYKHLAVKKINVVDGFLGLSNIGHLEKNDALAMSNALKAITESDTSTLLKATLGKVNVLGWQEDFKGAFALIDSLQEKYPNDKDVLSAYGRMNTWSKGFAKGASYYKKILDIEPSSFDGNLGFADTHHARGLDKTAFDYVRNTLAFYPGQRDALQFLEKLHVAHDPGIDASYFGSSDNGGNIATNYLIKATYDPHPHWRTSISYYSRKAENTRSIEIDKVKTVEQIQGGLAYQVNGWMKLGAQLAHIKSDTYGRWLTEFMTSLKIGKYQGLELFYKEELQYFNADLIKRNLKMVNLQANYNLSLPNKIGLYMQLIQTSVSDDNNRSLIFASLYYDLLKKPVLKAGVNFSAFGFNRQVPEIYFSPDIFKAYEVFIASENMNFPNTKWIYQFTGAAGLQQISKESAQGIYRFDIKAGRRFGERFNVYVYYMKSNSAASSVQGFTYNEWGIRSRWILPLRAN
ncbi:MAG: tetratricopeptide (TPR) repeat protein [Arcticibacterium sp.]|jgi:tetratricopeptide (TPR) repeat protein